MNRMMRWFECKHLPGHLQAVSAPVGELAAAMDAMLRKLLEAKDCFVRAKIEGEEQ